jgi:hypothetical protein
MLARPRADALLVVYRTLRLLSITCCAFVVISFVMFANEQLSSASRHQQTEVVTGINASTASSPAHQRGQPGRFIDGAASELTAPFRMIVQSGNQWVQHGIETAVALAFYGLGLGFLARYSRV